MKIAGIEDSIAYCEAMGLSNVFYHYAKFCGGEDIMEVGFNQWSGYVYIALENGVSICSCMGQKVEYLTTNDLLNGEETFFDDYDEALEYLNNQYERDYEM